MGISYRLTLGGDIPLRDVVEIAAPDAIETRTPAGGQLFSSALYEERGYLISLSSGRNGYYDAEDDDGYWEWEPAEFVNISFDMAKDDQVVEGVSNMVVTVARVLAGRPEDAALVLNGNWLLLTRVAGALRKHRSQWWAHYGVDALMLW
ncbi:SitI3 family protein [Polymorphospora sp. NPDC051019]|uniref:SitI3 family protein n=1 Tax=Polymorphospora sp. NPDC051019 TaxID=3155725 RepID=UPI00343350C1